MRNSRSWNISIVLQSSGCRLGIFREVTCAPTGSRCSCCRWKFELFSNQDPESARLQGATWKEQLISSGGEKCQHKHTDFCVLALRFQLLQAWRKVLVQCLFCSTTLQPHMLLFFPLYTIICQQKLLYINWHLQQLLDKQWKSRRRCLDKFALRRSREKTGFPEGPPVGKFAIQCLREAIS